MALRHLNTAELWVCMIGIVSIANSVTIMKNSFIDYCDWDSGFLLEGCFGLVGSFMESIPVGTEVQAFKPETCRALDPQP